MEDAKINQKEYLKRYLSKKDEGKKKKKKKIKTGQKSVKIIDDDIDLKNLVPIDDEEISIFNTTEDGPQIVGIIDERGSVDFANKQRWKLITDDGTGDIQISKVNQQKRDMLDKDNDNCIKSKKQYVLKDSKAEKHKSKYKSSGKKKKRRRSNRSSSSETENDHETKKKSIRKKNISKNQKKSRNDHSSSSDSSADSESDPSSDSDSDMSIPRSSKKKKKLSKKKCISSDSDLSPPRFLKINDTINRKTYNSNVNLSLLGNLKPKNSKISNSNINNLRQIKESKKASDKLRKRSVNLEYSYDSDVSLSKSNKKYELLDRRKMDDSKFHEHFNKYNEFNVHSEPYFKKCKDLNKANSDHNSARKSRSKHHKNSDSDLSPPRNLKLNNGKSDKYNSNLSPSQNSKSKSDKRSDKYDADLSPQKNSKSKSDKRFDKHDLYLSPSKNSWHNKYMNKYNFNHSPDRYSNSHYNKHSSKYYRKSNKYNSRSTPPRDYSKFRPKVSRWDEERKVPYKEKNKNESKNDSKKEKKNETKNETKNENRKERNQIEKNETKNQNKKMKKTLDGMSAGLQNLKSLKEEEEAQKKCEAEMMKNMSKEVSGYGQTTVVRDRRTGKKRDLEKEVTEREEKQKAQNEIDTKYSKWGKGLKQMKDRSDKLKIDLHEMSKPLARYADDADLDRELRARDREEDPMLAYIKEKEIKEGKRVPDKNKYEGSFLPNRFGIKPGYRWDGVDRSNGYEKKWFEAHNTKKAAEEEAYKWSTADM